MEKNQNIKYTTDGKKVVVVGNLNSQEKIVQEIFIVNGVEVPSGENFVVKSLHDAPAISWHEKKMKDIKEDYEKVYKITEESISQMRRKNSDLTEVFRKKAQWLQIATEKFDPSLFTTLIDILSGNIKYVVETQYISDIIEYKDFHETYERDLRLFSFYGKSNGEFSYGIGDYSDFSGGRRYYKFFTEHRDALEYLKNKILSEKVYHDKDIELADKYGFTLDEEKRKAYYDSKIHAINLNIESYNKNLENCKKSIEDINLKIK